MTLISDFVAGRTPPDLYDTYLTPMFSKWSDHLVTITPPTGQVLDIACGTGVVSRTLHDQSDVSSVTGIDVAEPMVAKAKSLSKTDANITYETASALELPFEDNRFDAAYCQQGFQFFPDKVQALREAKRVTKQDGLITIAIWANAAEGSPVFGAFEDIVRRELGEDLVPFGPFSLGDRAAIQAISEDAEVEVVSLKTEEVACPLPDPRSLVLFDLMFLGRPGPDGDLQPLFDPEDASKDTQIEAIIAELTSATKEFETTDGTLEAPMTANVLVAKA